MANTYILDITSKANQQHGGNIMSDEIKKFYEDNVRSMESFSIVDVAGSDFYHKQLPSHDFVLPALAKGSLGLLVAAGGKGKSMLAMQWSVAIASGKDLFNHFMDFDIKQGSVVYLTLEDDFLTASQRMQTIARDTMTADEWEALGHNLFIIKPTYSFRALDSDDKGASDEMKDISDFIKSKKPRLVVIDTLSMMLADRDENLTNSVFHLVSLVKGIAADNDCAVIMCHHISKGSDASTAEAARGSSAITNSARWVCSLAGTNDKEKGNKNFPDSVDTDSLIKMSLSKANYAAGIGTIWMKRGENGLLYKTSSEEERRLSNESDNLIKKVKGSDKDEDTSLI